MTNAGHDFRFCIKWRFSPKVRCAGTPVFTQKSFAFKEQRKQQSKEIRRACGVA
jgi:hypothetical protein